jgi:hypothetical protein
MVLRLAACMYTGWLIYLKYKYRMVLTNTGSNIARDLIQVLLSLIPIAMSLKYLFSKKYSVEKMLDPNSEQLDLTAIADQ